MYFGFLALSSLKNSSHRARLDQSCYTIVIAVVVFVNVVFIDVANVVDAHVAINIHLQFHIN